MQMNDLNQNQVSDKFHKDRFSRQNDEIRVHNPTDQDYILDYDGTKWMFPNQQKDNGYGAGDRVVPRYIAQRFMEEMVVFLINRENNDLLAKAKKEYKGDWWAGEEERIALRSNDPKLRSKYIPMIYRGVERKYGDDIEVAPLKPVDSKTIDVRLMELIDKEREASLKEISDEIAV